MGARRVVLLRAVNVGGASLPMAELRALATSLGAEDVATHIASGNLLCTPPGDPDVFDRALEQAVQERFGFFREAISRTPEQLRAALDAHPFEVVDARFSYVLFLLHPPEPAAVTAAQEVDTGPELWQLVGQDVHLRYAEGAGRAHPGLDKALRRLRTPATARNLNTVRKLVALTGS
ncbi:DUF1697 domain-containing protein [Auraticoccus monumenti]|uniref:Uncharacterized conserved protein, DUF1697 family n=1 Tax=Auraticoccus monumenti TaxID=675864 RepID=A0A1G6VTA5_9ACTN|nr:DUF1697 domain-containing protein [Auraticoccus monumenti]SDD56066.1 Uncharacterized conserved protein, DUF1697 family [Auraticoccus monumenti]